MEEHKHISLLQHSIEFNQEGSHINPDLLSGIKEQLENDKEL